ncbi:MAG: MmcB family DNA repair protein [Acetobacteraceae bacterium]|nr:MmcB family DNA repair protein [Acetobacteraceae bacterium]
MLEHLAVALPAPTLPERSAEVRRCTARLCLLLGWAPVHEVALPNGRRADILALAPNGDIACIEVKSGPRDFLTDGKWPEYREFCDRLFFAVDAEFPQTLIPDDVGLIVACPPQADLLRDAPVCRLAAPRRRLILNRIAWLAASRLATAQDPAGAAAAFAALRAD